MVVIVRKDMSTSMEDQNRDARVLKRKQITTVVAVLAVKTPTESTKANLEKCVV